MSSIGPVKRLFHQINITAGFNIPGYEKGEKHDHGIEAPETDVFEQGAWWKNRAVSVGLIDAGAENCACNKCSSCVSVLYEIQAVSLNGPSLPDESSENVSRIVSDEAGKEEDPVVKDEREEAGDKLTDDGLNLQQQIELSRLKSIDATVRAHERAHLAAAGGIVRGGASYQYRVGPDGKRYAVGGEVAIDTSEGFNPEATIRKMEAVRAAALAPAVPSAQDRRVAAQAAMAIMQARIELLSMEKVDGMQAEKKNPPSVTDIHNVAGPI